MKNYIFALLLSSAFATCFYQNSKFEYNGRFSPTIKKEKLNGVRFISEIMPEFCRYVSMPNRERAQFNQLLKSIDLPERNYRSILTYPPDNYIHTQKNYERIIDYVSIEIAVTSNGKTLAAQSPSYVLTNEQKNILNSSDLGTDIHIKIKFIYKNWVNNTINTVDVPKEAQYSVTVIPETEAEYPGGLKQLSTYLTTNIIDRISEKTASKNIQQAIVKFTVNADGKLVNAKLSRSSMDARTDLLILEAILKMPNWKPAKNSNGIQVKQEMSIPFGGGGC
jgi:TonB family protein